jgi:pimeloyl-ACP methyl ester carboxylesterase
MSQFRLAHPGLLWLALLVSSLAFLVACSSRVPARVVTVNGHQVEIATAGTIGAATVVFESGLGEDWTHWDRVASEVASHARIFAYSRPGYGASGPATTPRDAKQIVEELRMLLANAYEFHPPRTALE